MKQLFSANAIVFSKRLKKNFDPENMKKPHSNVAHNRPPTFFNVLAWLPKQPRNRNPVPRKAPYCRTGNLDWKSNFILESFIFIDFFFIPFHFFTILGITILQCSIALEIQLPFNSAFRLTYASKVGWPMLWRITTIY